MENETPKLTELQQVRLENFTLKHVAMQNAINENSRDRVVFIQSILAEHPGWSWRDPEGLVREEERVKESEEPYPETPMPHPISGNRKS